MNPCRQAFSRVLAGAISTFAGNRSGDAMKFILTLVVLYLLYRFLVRPPARILPPQEPDLFIDHEEVKREDGKNR